MTFIPAWYVGNYRCFATLHRILQTVNSSYVEKKKQEIYREKQREQAGGTGVLYVTVECWDIVSQKKRNEKA